MDNKGHQIFEQIQILLDNELFTKHGNVQQHYSLNLDHEVIKNCVGIRKATKLRRSLFFKDFWPKIHLCLCLCQRNFKASKILGQRFQRSLGKIPFCGRYFEEKLTKNGQILWLKIEKTQILMEANIIRQFFTMHTFRIAYFPLYAGKNLRFFEYLRRNYYLRRFFKIPKNLRPFF